MKNGTARGGARSGPKRWSLDNRTQIVCSSCQDSTLSLVRHMHYFWFPPNGQQEKVQANTSHQPVHLTAQTLSGGELVDQTLAF